MHNLDWNNYFDNDRESGAEILQDEKELKSLNQYSDVKIFTSEEIAAYNNQEG